MDRSVHAFLAFITANEDQVFQHIVSDGAAHQYAKFVQVGRPFLVGPQGVIVLEKMIEVDVVEAF